MHRSYTNPLDLIIKNMHSNYLFIFLYKKNKMIAQKIIQELYSKIIPTSLSSGSDTTKAYSYDPYPRDVMLMILPFSRIDCCH